MILTNKIASENIGKYIHAYRKLEGYYPMQIITSKCDGSLMVKDRVGVCMRIEDKGFNATHYDYISDAPEDGDAQ